MTPIADDILENVDTEVWISMGIALLAVAVIIGTLYVVGNLSVSLFSRLWTHRDHIEPLRSLTVQEPSAATLPAALAIHQSSDRKNRPLTNHAGVSGNLLSPLSSANELCSSILGILADDCDGPTLVETMGHLPVRETADLLDRE